MGERSGLDQLAGTLWQCHALKGAGVVQAGPAVLDGAPLAGKYGPESARARMLRPNGLDKMSVRRVQIATRTKLQEEGNRKNPPTASQ